MYLYLDKQSSVLQHILPDHTSSLSEQSLKYFAAILLNTFGITPISDKLMGFKYKQVIEYFNGAWRF
jgi:hypothetical protein